jgi:hypothetical protein
MAISAQRAGAVRLKGAINAYRFKGADKLRKPALELLARLSDSPDAATAFYRLRLTLDQAVEVLTICIEADDLFRTFPRRIRNAEKNFQLAENLGQAVAKLRKFAPEFHGQKVPLPSDLAGLPQFDPPADIAAVKDALRLIARWIDWGRGVAEITLAQIGTTRKTQPKQAAENAAIWYLCARVQSVAGKPVGVNKRDRRRLYWPEITDLAQIVLGIELSMDRVRHVVSKRTELYLDTFRKQSQRYYNNIAADARRRQA